MVYSVAKPRFRSFASLRSKIVGASAVGFVLTAGVLYPMPAFAQKARPGAPTAPLIPVEKPVTADDLGLSQTVIDQMGAIMDDKVNWTAAQQKIDAHLIYATRRFLGQPVVPGRTDINYTAYVPVNSKGEVVVRISGVISAALLNGISASGGTVLTTYPEYNVVKARLPLAQLETVAGLADVFSIKLPLPGRAKIDVFTEGDVAHQANTFRASAAAAGAGGTGKGVKIGVLSDGVDSYSGTTINSNGTANPNGRLGASVTNGNLSTVTIAQTDAGPNRPSIYLNGGGDEGTAMLEIIRDIAPNASLFYATGFPTYNPPGQSGAYPTLDDGNDNSPIIEDFARNILLLRNKYGCDIVIDDIGYAAEAPFQDDILAQAANAVAASGGMFFSAAGNEGNLSIGKNAAVWQGNFNNGGRINLPTNNPTVPPKTLNKPNAGFFVHSYNGTFYNTSTVTVYGTRPTTYNAATYTPGQTEVLNWSDPLSNASAGLPATPVTGSSNDYDLFVTNSAGTALVDFSTTTQNGSQDPQEFVSAFQNERIYIVGVPAQVPAGSDLPPNPVPPATRALRLHAAFAPAQGNALTFVTNGNVYGHSAGKLVYSVSATPALKAANGLPIVFTTSNVTEGFTVDGPRQLFYNAAGKLIDATGDVVSNQQQDPLFNSAVGQVLSKPDITAADGVTTSVSGFNPFYGTSAAAPHAGAIAALIKSYKSPAATRTQVDGSKLSTVRNYFGSASNTLTAITDTEMFLTLTGSALDIDNAGYDEVAGYGIVMPVAALNFLTNFVTNRTASNITRTSAVISFGTNLPANAILRVVPTASYNPANLSNATTFTETGNSTSHLFSLTSLAQGTQYTYIISAKTPTGSVSYADADSAVGTFTTIAPPVVTPTPVPAPAITVKSASAIRSGSEVIVTVNLVNTGNAVAAKITINGASLDGVATTTKVPYVAGTSLYPNASLPTPVRFPYPTGRTGQTATVSINGVLSTGTAFSGSAVVRIP